MRLTSNAKFEEKLACGFRKWHNEFGKFLPEHLNVSKLRLWLDPYIQVRKCTNLKVTEELCHDNEEWCKIWKGIDLLKFDEFWLEHWKLWKMCTLFGSFWSKYTVFEPKKYRGVMFRDTEEWCKVWRGIDLSFQN